MSRQYHHHRNSKKRGPRLPGTLLKELGGFNGSERVPHSKNKGSVQRKNTKKRGRNPGSEDTIPRSRPIQHDTTRNQENLTKKIKERNDGSHQQAFSRDLEATKDPEMILQKQLAKKLGMKSTDLGKKEDGLDDLLNELDDIMMGNDDEDSFDVEEESEEENQQSQEFSISTSDTSTINSDSEKDIISQKEEMTLIGDTSSQQTKYIPPALRKKMRCDGGENMDAQEAAVSRRVRGLVNRMTEANIESIVVELCGMYENEGRSYVSQSLSHELISASCEGPRASERFAIVAAACIASVGGLTGSSEIVATFLAKLGMNLEKSLQEKDSLACANLVRLLGCMYLSKAIKSDLLFDVLSTWGNVFSDQHVVSIAGLLTVVGLALRKSDPSRMKNFVIDIHDKASKHGEITTRAKVMLDLVIDVKNNRMKSRQGALSISANGSATLANALPPNAATWFKKCNVENIAVGGIPWSKVVCATNKGFWWIPTMDDRIGKDDREESIPMLPERNGEEIDSVSNAELLQLASKLKMSTDTRKAIFLAIMGSEDAIDAAEKLLRLSLKGQQEREIVRVAIECSLHEKTWNVYYGLVLRRLCKLAKGHRVTLQYCIWDHMKDVGRMNARKLAIFSKLCAYIIVSKVLPLHTLIKVSEFTLADMGAKELLLWRTFFKSIFEDVPSQESFRDIFHKIIQEKDLSSLRKRLKMFLKTDVGPWLASKSVNTNQEEEKNLLKILTLCNEAEKILTK